MKTVKHENKGIWIVIDENGYPIYCAGWPEACHEHINDAINNFQIEEAEKWKVREAKFVHNAKGNGLAALSPVPLTDWLEGN